ncbi:zinc finger, CCHC-type containing protein [Tanacetum coccineum]
MMETKFDINKFYRKNDFGLWHVRMKALLEQQGLAVALEELPATMIVVYDNEFLLLTSLPSSYDNFMETLLYGRDTLKLEDVLAILNSKELQKMTEAKGDGGEGLYVRRRSGQRDMEQGTDGVWSKSQGRSSKLKCHICQSEEHLKRDCPKYNYKKSQGFVRNENQVSGSGADEYDSANVMMAMSVEELLDWIMNSGGSYHMTYKRDYLFDFEKYEDGNVLLGDGRECRVRGTGTLEKKGFIVKMQSGKIKVIKGSLVVLSGTKRANCVYTLDGQAVTRKTLKGRKQLGEF